CRAERRDGVAAVRAARLARQSVGGDGETSACRGGRGAGEEGRATAAEERTAAAEEGGAAAEEGGTAAAERGGRRRRVRRVRPVVDPARLEEVHGGARRQGAVDRRRARRSDLGDRAERRSLPVDQEQTVRQTDARAD